VIDRLARVIDPGALHALLTGLALDLSGEAAAIDSARRLQATVGDEALSVEARYDATLEAWRLVLVRIQHGTPHVTVLDADFLASGDHAQLRAAAAVLQGLVQPGANVRRGDSQVAVRTFKEALDWLLAEARSAVSLQRYKGLGEMNPEQLWETTMDPGVRRLLRVQIEDAITSEEIFSTLMGEEVEPRRAFIESNALGVRNLDV
jgi:DNA gyrase subunit B